MPTYRYNKDTDSVEMVSKSHGCFPDVYFKSEYFDENMADPNDPVSMHGSWITSKRQKAALMRQLRVRESGDLVRGKRIMDLNPGRRRTYI